VCWRSVLPCDGGKFSGGGAICVHDDGDRQHLHELRKRWRFFPQYHAAGRPERQCQRYDNEFRHGCRLHITNKRRRQRHRDKFRHNTGGFFAQTMNGGNATATNSGSNTGGEFIAQTNAGGNATATNSGTANSFESATIGGGNATATNSGSNVGGFVAQTAFGGQLAASANSAPTA
jgi:hypothetical protein